MINQENPFRTKAFVERYIAFRQQEEFKSFCEKRKFTDAFIKATGLSYFSQKLLSSNFTKETQRELGVLSGSFTVYKSHVVFPCFTLDERFCGFIGRTTLQDVQPKYQLPQHILFSKESYLHGFYRYLNTAESFCFVSENMVEWGRVLEFGFPAVGLNGAYKSKFKLSVLANRFKHLIFIADNDLAGQELKTFAKEYLNELGTDIQFVTHNFKGLDEFYCAKGPEETKQLLQQYVKGFNK